MEDNEMKEKVTSWAATIIIAAIVFAVVAFVFAGTWWGVTSLIGG